MDDLISRQAAIDAVDSETVSTNPEHFKSSEKFIKFMDDADISSFGIWQWSNGFNTALVATTIQLKKLPSAQPEPCEDAVSREVLKDGFTEMCNLICPYTKKQQHVMCGSCLMGTAFDVLEATSSVTPKQRTGEWIDVDDHYNRISGRCSVCGWEALLYETDVVGMDFCPNCGADMREVTE